MRRKILLCLTVFTLSLASSLTAFAAPETMADGSLFDAEYYAQNNPDVVQAFGTDKNLLYSHYVNNGKAEGRLPYDESQLDFATKAMQKFSFNPRDIIEFLEINAVPVTIEELRADIRPHASTYSIKAGKENEEYIVPNIDVYDIPMANYIYCCEFDKYVAEKALIGFTLDPSKTKIKMSYGHYIQELANIYNSKITRTEVAGYTLEGRLAFITKEGFTVYRYCELRNNLSDGLIITKDKEDYSTSSDVGVHKMRDYNGRRVMNAYGRDYMSYMEFLQLLAEGKVKLYSGESYGIAYAPLGGYSETHEYVTNEPVYVE